MAYYLFILAIGVERLVELAVARRNAAWSIAHGGKVFDRGHYPVIGYAWVALGCVHARSLGLATAVQPLARLADGGCCAHEHRCPLVVHRRARQILEHTDH